MNKNRVLLSVLATVALMFSACDDASKTTELEGTYSDGDGLSFTFKGSSVNVAYETRDTIGIYNSAQSGSFSFKGTKTLQPNNVEVKKMQLNINDCDNTLTPISETSANSLNSKEFCGSSTWKVDKTQSINACLDDCSVYIDKKIYQLQEDNTLLFGTSKSAVDNDGYPEELGSTVYSKVIN